MQNVDYSILHIGSTLKQSLTPFLLISAKHRRMIN